MIKINIKRPSNQAFTVHPDGGEDEGRTPIEEISTGLNPMEEEICLVYSSNTNSILRDTKYFQTLTKRQEMFNNRWTRCNNSRI